MYLVFVYKVTRAHNLDNFNLLGDEILLILEICYTHGELGILLF